jgi:threonine synthase
MDILISSNLERLLYGLCGCDSAAVAALMKTLGEDGAYTVSDTVKSRLQSEFWGGFSTGAEVAETIESTFGRQGYLPDTHTAVALHVHGQYVQATGDHTQTSVVSTANPYKFAPNILTALTGKQSDEDEFAQIAALHALTGTEVPPQLAALKGKAVRFGETVAKENMSQAVEKMLGL